MKINFGLRTLIIAVFVILYITSILLINSYFNYKLKILNNVYQELNIDKQLSEMEFSDNQQKEKINNIMKKFREIEAASDAIQRETKIFSAVYLLFLIVISVGLFIIFFYIITKLLQDLQQVKKSITKGNFSVQIPETGIREIKELKKSFNSMSSELEKTQQDLLKAEKFLIWKKLSRTLAHEIKNPLTPIKLSVERLQEKFLTDKTKFEQIFPETIEIINDEADKLFKLVRSFSEFAKDKQPEISAFKPVEVLKSIIKPYQMQNKIEIVNKTEKKILFDEMHFNQVVTNILQNAIAFTKPDELIKIIIQTRGNEIEIFFIDHGQGIREQDLKHIFEPYFSKRKKGLGLGMSLVKKLVEHNDANIEVESEFGQGTTFKIYKKLY